MKKQELRIPVQVREKNRRLALALSSVVAFCAPVLGGRLAAWLLNQVLHLYQVETRVANGPWQRVDHGIQFEPV